MHVPRSPIRPFHLNPHLFGLDGSYEISGAGATYLVSKALDKQNADLAALAIIGAVGDLQDRRFCELRGVNRDIINHALSTNSLSVIQDLRCFGKETRPLPKLLQFANDPFIPGITGREEACSTFLQDLGIRLKDGEEQRRWIHLEAWEKQKIVSALTQMLLAKGFGYRIALRLIGENYLLIREEIGTELHDAKEFATLLNSTGRYGQEEVGLQVCLGDVANGTAKPSTYCAGIASISSKACSSPVKRRFRSATTSSSSMQVMASAIPSSGLSRT